MTQPRRPFPRTLSAARPARAAALVFAAALAAATLAAQAPLSPYGEVLDVQLVLLEVLATDAEGRTVPDLTAADLRVYEDGQPVAIEHFEAIGGTAATVAMDGSASARQAEAPPLHLAVFIDEVHVGAASRKLMLHELVDTLTGQLRPVDRVMVALYDGTTRVLLPFTNDRKALSDALLGVETVSAARLTVEQDWRSTLEALFQDASGEFGWSPCLHMKEFVDGYAEREDVRVRQAVDGFGTFVDALAGFDGRKAVIHVSDGIPTRSGQAAADHALELCNGVGASQGVPGGTDYRGTWDKYDEHQTFQGTYDSTSRWEEVTARANAGNVSVYTFQAGPSHRTDPAPIDTRLSRQSAVSLAAQRANLQETLFLLADRTGGRAVFEGADLGRELTASLGELRSYYLLSYALPAPERQEMRRVRVESLRPGVTLRHRKVYRPRSPHEQVADRLLGRLLYGGGDLDPEALRLELGARQAASEDRVKARFRLQVPLSTLALTDQRELRQGMFTVFVAVADDEGIATPVRKATVPVRVAKEGPESFLWEVEMLLRPGQHDVAMAIRDEISGEASYVVERFDLRRPRAGHPAP